MCTLDVCLRVYPGIGAHDAETKDHPYVSFFDHSPPYFFEAESLREAGAHSFGLTGLPVSSQDISTTASLNVRVTDVCLPCPDFTRLLR